MDPLACGTPTTGTTFKYGHHGFTVHTNRSPSQRAQWSVPPSTRLAKGLVSEPLGLAMVLRNESDAYTIRWCASCYIPKSVRRWCSTLELDKYHFVSIGALILAVVYQMAAAWNLPAHFLTRPVIAIGLGIVALSHIILQPQLAGRLSCCTLLAIAAQHFLTAACGVIGSELNPNFTFYGEALRCTCVGAFLACHPHLPRQDRWGTFILFNAIYLSRGFMLYLRTGTWQFVLFAQHCVCLPFCASFLLVMSPWMFDLRRCRRRIPHEATPIHVDSRCSMCPDFAATVVLQPCGLGLCPDCLLALQRPRAYMPQRSHIICPKCLECTHQWLHIRHCDLEDEKTV